MHSRLVAFCCLAVVIALYVVGAVSVPPGSLRHEVQTLSLWVPMVLGFQQRPLAKWVAIPMLAFWLLIVVLIWLFLLGWARVVTGHFFPTEVAMTLVIGAAAMVGLAACARWRTTTSPVVAVTAAVASLLLQVAVFRVSLIPYIAGR